MAERLLQRAEVGSALDLADGEAVSKGMGSDTVTESGTGGVVLDYLPESLACELVSAPIEEQRGLFLVVEQVESSVRDVLAQ